MKRILLVITFILLSLNILSAQTLYSQAYGDPANPALIFMHGGPSSNAILFESTTAQKLADHGFYVIAYDRRGEGRSADLNATFTFKESGDDLVELYKKYQIKQGTLLAHSFGGIVAAYVAEQHPELVESIVLVSALFSQQETYDHIFNTVEQLFRKNGNLEMLAKVEEAKQLPKNTAGYRRACFDFTDGMMDMPIPTKESNALWEKYQHSELYKNNIRNRNAPSVFFKHEALNNVDTKAVLRNLQTQGIKIYAIYGKQDGLFSAKQMKDMQKITGKRDFILVDNCGHFPYVDQQKIFVETMIKYLK